MRRFFNFVSKLALIALVATSVVPLNSISVAKAAANWDVSGNYTFRFVYNGSEYDHNVNLNQNVSNDLTGGGSHAAYAWSLISGNVVNDNIVFSANYTATADAVTPLTTMQVTGTVAAGGSMSGTWSDNYQGGSRQGTWSTVQGTAEENTTNIIVVTANTTNTENTPGWMFNRDVSTSTPFLFNTGNEQIGTGSLQIDPIGANPSDKMIAENFINKPIADIDSISFDYKLGVGNEGRDEHVYMNVYANFGYSDDLKFYDCRYTVLANIASSGNYTTITFDPTVAPYSVFTRTGGSAPIYTCPAIPADMNTLSPGSNVRMFALNMGDTSDEDLGMSGYFDNVVVVTNEGTTIYDFEPAPPRTPSNIQIIKEWQDSNGVVVPAPSNKGDITITVTTENGNDDECTYNGNGVLECDGSINSYTDETIEVEETGVPAGWTVVDATVGDEIVPVCPQVGDDFKGAVDCTHKVINKQNTPKPCNQELVVNGSFELPNVTKSEKWDVYPSGTPSLGWSAEWINNVGGAQPVKANVEIHKNGVVGGWSANEGDQYTELDSDWTGPDNAQTGENASVRIYQDLVTKVGGNYTVTFYASPRPDQSAADNSIRVKVGSVNAVVNATSSSSIVWSKYTYTFEATSNVTRLEFADEGPGNSFGGFLDDVSVKEDCVSDVVVCKEDTYGKKLSGWTVFLKGDKLETVEVKPDGTNYLSSELVAGKYALEAKGTYTYRPGSSGDISDAGFTKREVGELGATVGNQWIDVNTLPGSWAGYLGLQVDGVNPAWGPLNLVDHEYNITKVLPVDNKISFRILDDVYSDNSGKLTVSIYPIYEGVTGEDGCVTLQNVPYSPNGGTEYTLDEVMQDGWENESGKGSEVIVDGNDDVFTLVNECTGENCVIPCTEEGFGWASSVVTGEGKTWQGLRKNNTPVIAQRSNPSLAVGEADWVSGGSNGFYSLGFDGYITLEFSGYVNNVTGSDLNIYEATNGTYPAETAKVEVSQDGNTWYEAAAEIGRGTTGVDFGATGLNWIKFVKITDTSIRSNFPQADADGFDLDAVEAVSETCEPIVIVEPCTEEDIVVMSGSQTMFLGVKQGGSAPTDFNDETQYPLGTDAPAVEVVPTGYIGAWTAGNDSNLSGAQWISNDATQPTGAGLGIYNGNEDSWRLFKHEFSIPAGASNISSPITLYFAADNAVTVFLDGVEIATTGDMAAGGNPAPHFQTAASVVIPTLSAGNHVLEFAVRNSAFQAENNPTGLIYKLDTITFDCGNPTPPCKDYDFKKVGFSFVVETFKMLVGKDSPCFSISGYVYHDQNNNGQQDVESPNPADDDGGLSGWKVYIDANDDDTYNEGEVFATTDVDGYYIIDGLVAGCYTVREELESGWIHGVEPGDNEYLVSVGGYSCGEGFTFGFIKTAMAATSIIGTPNAENVDFGNVEVQRTGGGGSRGSSGGSSTPTDQPDRPGQILGDSTTTPSEGQVAGAATTLPRTGTPTWVILMLVLLAAPAVGIKALSIRKA